MKTPGYSAFTQHCAPISSGDEAACPSHRARDQVQVSLPRDKNATMVESATPGDSSAFERTTHRAPPPLEAVGAPPDPAPLFDGVFLGGFECSCHALEDGRRLDMTRATQHDEFSQQDYTRLRDLGMTACRDGVSWHAVERRPNTYDFSSARSRVRAADSSGVRVIWDLMHFGWPDDIDIFSPSFPGRFARYAGAFAKWLASETDAPVMVAPINEMSYLSWAGGDVRCMNPFQAARGVELKVQLVRATIGAIEAIRDVIPNARFLQPEPVINIVADPNHPKTWRRVESDNLLQFQVWDMLCGRIWPALGGNEKYLDIIGVNFYSDNQFMLDGTTIFRGDPRYRPFAEMLVDVWDRYRRPMIVSETGNEGSERQAWLSYVCDECLTALDAGCELHGVTLYPILNTLGWGDDRRCENGLWDDADARGERPIHLPLAEEIERQTPRLRASRAQRLARHARARLIV